MSNSTRYEGAEYAPYFLHFLRNRRYIREEVYLRTRELSSFFQVEKVNF
jgi:hypothetical protein